MKIIFLHIFRNIKEKKGRSILIILSLLIASCVFVLNLIIPNKIIEETKNKYRQNIGNADILISSYNPFDINDIRLYDNEIEILGVNQVQTTYKNKTFMIYGTSIDKAKKFKLLDDVYPLKDNEIIINEKVAKKNKLNINDYIEVNINNNIYKYKIVNICNSKGLLSYNTYSGIINNNSFNNILGIDSNMYSDYYLDIKDIDPKEFIQNTENDNYKIINLFDEEAIKTETDYTSAVLVLIFIMATIMIFFVVSTLNKIIILERVPVIATFRSIGATKNKTNAILILENVMYGLIGGTLGSLLALIINNNVTQLLMGQKSITISNDVSLINILFGIMFSVLLEIIMSINSILKQSKRTIKDLLFDNINSQYVLNKKESIVGFIFLINSLVIYLINSNSSLINLLNLILFWIGLALILPKILGLLSKLFQLINIKNGAFSLAIKNIKNNKLIISSVRLVVVAISIILLILNISNSFDRILNGFKYQFNDYNIFIRDTTKVNTTYESLINLDGIEEVGNVYMISNNSVFHNKKRFKTETIILGMKNSRPDIEEYNYKIKDLKKNEILIDEVYAKNNNVKIGDTISIKYDEINKNYNYKIVGTVNSFYQSLGREIIIINENHFINDISNIPFQVYVKINKNYNEQNVIKNIENKLNDSDVTIFTVDEFCNEQKQNIGMIMSLFYIIVSLVVLLVFVGIINNQIINFIERRKELAVLNSVCMSKNNLIKMLIYECLISNVISCIIGFCSAIISLKIMNKILYGINLYIPLKFNFLIGIILIFVVLIILLTTIIIPIKRFRKMNIVEEIKYE